MNVSSVLPLALGLILFSFLINSALIVPFIDYLYKIKLIRKRQAEGRNARNEGQKLFDKLHDVKVGTPIGGGILLIITTMVTFAVLFPLVSKLGVYVQTAYPLRNELVVIFVTFLVFGLLGLLDDVVKIYGKPKEGFLAANFGLSSKHKFMLQWLVALFVGWWLYTQLGIHILHIPLIPKVIDLGIFYIPFAALVIVFFTNAFNFTDGLDGLSSGLLMIYLFAYIVITASHLDTPLFIFIAIWLGAIIAFLYFNVYPARIMLGDAGALSFGATIAVIGLLVGNITVLFVIGGLFVIEALSSAIQILGWRILKRPIFPLAPLHHTFQAIGWEEPKIVMRAWLAGIILAIFGLWLATI